MKKETNELGTISSELINKAMSDLKDFLKRVEDCPQTLLNEAQKASLNDIRKKAEALCAKAEKDNYRLGELVPDITSSNIRYSEALGELREGKGTRSVYKLKYHSMYPELIVKIPHTFSNAKMVIAYGEFLEKIARCMASDKDNDQDIYLDLVSTKEEKEVLTDWCYKISRNKSIYTDLFLENEDELSEAELASLSEEANKRKNDPYNIMMDELEKLGFLR